MAGSVVDLFMVYQFIKKLTTPFSRWKANELGIIDDKGNLLKSRKELRTVKEREAFGRFDHLILNVKKLLQKMPGGQSRVGSYAAALWLIKEGEDLDADALTEEMLNEYIEQAEKMLSEEAPVNAVGGGAVEGMTKDSEPGVSKKAQKKYKMKNTVGKRVPDATLLGKWR